MNKKLMLCINHTDYADCMTVGNHYWVEIEDMPNGTKMYKFLDDRGEPLQTMLERFTPVEIKKNDIIQVHPYVDTWGGCLMQVSEIGTWGVTASLRVPRHGTAYIRISNGTFDLVGKAIYEPRDCCVGCEKADHKNYDKCGACSNAG